MQIASLHVYTTLMYFWLSFLFLWLCGDAIINFATQLWSLSAVKKDVIACSSVSQEDGRNIPKQSDIKKSSVKTYDKRQDSVGLYFWKGLTIRYSLCKEQLPGMSGKRRKRVFFFFLGRDVWNKFMLEAVVETFWKDRWFDAFKLNQNIGSKLLVLFSQ